MIRFELLDSGLDRALQTLAQSAPRIELAVRRQMISEMMDLASYSAEEKLSGQILQPRSGALRRALLASPAVESISGMAIGTVGVDSSVPYGAIHEFGFEGTESVREYMRRTKTGRMAPVRAHSRQMYMPQRSYLRSAIGDRLQQIAANLQQAVSEAVEQP